MHGGGDDIARSGTGRRVQAGGDQAGEVRHVDPELRADLVGDGAEGGEVELARVGGPAGDDAPAACTSSALSRTTSMSTRNGLGVDAVGGGLVELAGEVELHAVGEVAAVGELEAEDACRRAWRSRRAPRRWRWRPECGCTLAYSAPNSDLARSIASCLGDVDELAAAVVAAAGVALGVLVGEHGTLRLEHGARHEVLARDHLEVVALAAELAARAPRRSRGRRSRAGR